jgi:hypothetical protein
MIAPQCATIAPKVIQVPFPQPTESDPFVASRTRLREMSIRATSIAQTKVASNVGTMFSSKVRIGTAWTVDGRNVTNSDDRKVTRVSTHATENGDG